jgi:hypothetical protein
MDDQGIIIVVSLTFLLLALAISLLWLLRKLYKIQKRQEVMQAQLQRTIDDVVGLCSAAVAVDRRLAVGEERLASLINAIELQQQDIDVADTIENDAQEDYSAAIQMIRQGAEAEDLVKSCGLTRDEAVLLIRLHGKR